MKCFPVETAGKCMNKFQITFLSIFTLCLVTIYLPVKFVKKALKWA